MSTNTQSSLLWKVLGATGLVLGLAALIVSIAIASGDESGSSSEITQYGPEKGLMKGADHAEEEHAPDPNAPVEEYQRPDPTLPDVPPGKVKRFAIDVSERLTRVSKEKPSLRVWSYSVNGTKLSGTGGSPPIVVNEGDKVEISLTNGSSEAMEVHFPHSFDTHAAEVSPQKAYRDAKPGKTVRFTFDAKHPGVYMYHCGTKPVLRHVGSGMVGMMVVRPRDLPKVDRELWLTQQEFYLGEPGGDASVDKMVAKTPDVIAFNGFASQYLDAPIPVKRGERIRVWLVNGGPSLPSYFHVIGTVFDRVWSEGDTRKHSQTMTLGPAEGGFVEFTLDAEGTFPFVTHGFGDMVRGAIGALKTANAPAAAPAEDSMPDDMPGMDHDAMSDSHDEKEE